MASLALGLTGAAVGSAFGYPGLGWVGGMLLGNLLDGPEDTHEERFGPRLNSRVVQLSSYGVAVPIVYGTMRVAGNVVWLRNNEIDETIITMVETQEQPKGLFSGPEHTVTTTTYRYTARFAVLLCLGEITAITRIWWNGNLVWDRRTGSPAGDLPIAIYTGTETQEADPTMVEALGVDETPALRGYAYVVFRDVELELGGNTIGNWEFEVVKSGTIDYPGPEPISYDPVGNTGGMVRDPRTGLLWTIAGATVDEMLVIDPLNNQVVSSFPVLPGAYNQRDQIAFQPELTLLDLTTGEPTTIPARMWYSDNGISPQRIGVVDADTHEHVTTISISPNNDTFLKWDPALGRIVYFRSQGTAWIGTINPLTFVSNDIRWVSNNPLHDLILDAVFAAEYGYWILLYEDSTIGLILAGDPSYSDFLLAMPPWGHSASDHGQLAYDPTRGRIWATMSIASAVGQGWGYFDLATLAFVQTFDHRVYQSCIYHPGMDAVIAWKKDSEGPYLNAELLIFNASDGSIRDWMPWNDVNDAPFISPPDKMIVVPEAGDVFAYGRDLNNTFRVYLTRLATDNAITLKEIVEDVCERVGMHDLEVDASALTESIKGYLVPQQMTGRAAIEGLQQYGHFGGVESDTQITFPLRNGVAVKALTDDDLVIDAAGQIEAAPRYFNIRRIEEAELPREVAVTFISPALNYQQSTHRARRLLTRSENHLAVDMAISMTDETAKRKTDILIDTAWQEREIYTFSLSHEEADLNPLDSVTITLDGDAFEAIVETLRYTPAGQMEITAKSRDAGSYTSTSTASLAEGVGNDSVSIVGSTNLAIVDAPLLVDAHGGQTEAGLYLFAAPFTTTDGGWRGVNVYKSPDSQSWNLWASAVRSTAMGIGVTPSTEVAYPEYATINREASLTVRMASGTLSSIDEDDLYTGKNAALWGGEIIQYTTATLEADGTYTLTGLVRGRRGTENWMDHPQKGERFIVLNHPVLRVATDPGERGQEFYYHSVSLGQQFQRGTTRAFINTEKGLKPYAPVHIEGEWDNPSSNDITITWMARARTGAQRLPEGTTIGTAEASESYEVDILSDDGETVLRTLGPVSSKSATYTSAQQTTDFGGDRSWVRIKAYQLSATVGRGFAGEAWIVEPGSDVYEEDFSGASGWNSIDSPATTGVRIADLLDDIGATTGISIDQITAFASAFSITVAAGDHHGWPNAIWNPVWTYNGTAEIHAFTLAGFTSGDTLTFRIAGFRGTGRDTIFTLKDSGGIDLGAGSITYDDSSTTTPTAPVDLLATAPADGIVRIYIQESNAADIIYLTGLEFAINPSTDNLRVKINLSDTTSPSLPPTRWSSKYSSVFTSWDVTADGSPPDDKYLAMRASTTSLYAFAPDNSDRASRRNVLFRFRCPTSTSGTLMAFTLYVRGAGSYTHPGTTHTATAATFRVVANLSGWGFRAQTPASEDNVSSSLVSQTITAGTWYWGRVDIHGKVMRGRVWADGSDEPTAYALEWTDPNLPLEGWLGVGFFNAANDADLNFLRVKYGGGNA